MLLRAAVGEADPLARPSPPAIHKNEIAGAALCSAQICHAARRHPMDKEDPSIALIFQCRLLGDDPVPRCARRRSGRMIDRSKGPSSIVAPNWIPLKRAGRV